MNEWLRKRLETTEPDLLREIVQTFAEVLMSVDGDEVCGAPFEGLVETLGIASLSKSQVSEMARELEQLVDDTNDNVSSYSTGTITKSR